MPKLTKRTVDGLKTKDTDYIVWDTELKGFGVRVLPSGRKSFLVQYRAGGRTRRIKIARYGNITTEDARQRAKDLLGDVAKGKNPAQIAGDYRRVPTVAQMCDRFISTHIDVHLKPSTAGEYKRCIELFIKPALGTHKITDVHRTDIATMHHKLRHKPYQSNRVLGVLSKLFNLCEMWGLRPDGSNPCRHVQKYKEVKRERFLSKQEFADLWQTLDEREAAGLETSHVAAAFKLLLLTGCRLGEIQKLKWSEVGNGYLELEDTKTGRRRVTLSPEAQAVLSGIDREEDNPYVIIGEVENQHVTDLQRPWRRIRIQAGIPDVRIHDLRHTYASYAVMEGVPLPIVARLLGHTQIQTTMRYAHLADDAVREASALVGSTFSGFAKTARKKTGPNLRLVT